MNLYIQYIYVYSFKTPYTKNNQILRNLFRKSTEMSTCSWHLIAINSIPRSRSTGWGDHPSKSPAMEAMYRRICWCRSAFNIWKWLERTPKVNDMDDNDEFPGKNAISRYLVYGCVWSIFLCFFQFTYIWSCSCGGEDKKIPPYIEHL